MHEVVGRGDGTIAGVLAATEAELTWGHRQVFARLDRMADELRADRSQASSRPRSRSTTSSSRRAWPSPAST